MARRSFGHQDRLQDLRRVRRAPTSDPGGADDGDSKYLRLDATNDPVTGPVDIVVDDEHALRVLTEPITPSLLSAGAWIMTGTAIYYPTHWEPANPTATTWAAVAALPSGLTAISQCVPALDDSALYIIATVSSVRGLWYCTNPRTGSPTWTKLIAIGDAFEGLVIGGALLYLVQSGNLISTTVLCGETVDGYMDHGYLAEFNGAAVTSYLLSDNYEFWYGRSPGPRAYNHDRLLRSALAGHTPIGFFNTGDGRSPDPIIGANGHYYAVEEEYTAFDDHPGHAVSALVDITAGTILLLYETDTVTVGFGLGSALDSTKQYPRRAPSGAEIVVVNNVGTLYRLTDGETPVEVATWDVGPVEPETIEGGGRYVWLKRQVDHGDPVIKILAQDGSWVGDATGDLWSVLPAGAAHFIDLHVVYGAGAVEGGAASVEVFNVDTVDQIVSGTQFEATTTTDPPLIVHNEELVEHLNAALLGGHPAADFAETDHAHAASEITNTPAGGIVATDVQAALNELDGDKAAAGHTHTYPGDADALHDNVAGEIAAVTAKTTPVSADVLIIEDSADSYAKKSITVGDLPTSGGGIAGTTSKIEIGIDGGGDVPTTGILLDFEVPCDLTITGWTLLADASGSLVIDLWRDSYANYPPAGADTQTGSDKPTLSGAVSSTSSALTGWTVAWSAGDVIRVNVDSAATLHRAVLVLNYTRS